MTDLKQLVNQHVKECKVIDEKMIEQKEQSSTFINQVFHNLKLICPAWKQNFDSTQAYKATKELWLNTLIEEGITTQEQVNRGLKAAKLNASAFFPSIGQFVSWTKKAAPRVYETAYKEFDYKEIAKHTKQEYIDIAANKYKKLIEQLKGE